MKLNVPMIPQARNSVDCGLAMVAMISNYYGEKVTIKDLKEEIKVYKNQGTYMPQLGIYFLNHGFSVEIISQDLHLFTLQDRSRSQENLERKLRRLQKEAREQNLQYRYIDGDANPATRIFGHYTDFLSQGGQITVKIPSEENIKNEIGSGRPIGVSLTSCFLYSSTPYLNSHANVVVGIGKRDIFVQDPIWDVGGGRHKYQIKDYLYAIHANNGELLCVRK